MVRILNQTGEVGSEVWIGYRAAAGRGCSRYTKSIVGTKEIIYQSWNTNLEGRVPFCTYVCVERTLLELWRREKRCWKSRDGYNGIYMCGRAIFC